MDDFSQESVAIAGNAFKKCAGYGRFSTIMQRLSSLADQRQSCLTFADTKGWVLLPEHWYTDEAKSGTSRSGRQGLSSLEAAAEQRPLPFDYVLFDDTSRLGRDVEDVLRFVKLMKYHKIGVRFVSQNLDSNDNNFELLLQVHAMVDSQSIGRIRYKVFNAQKNLVLAGFHVGSVPYGYQCKSIVNPDNPKGDGQSGTTGSKLVKVPAQEAVVTRIFELFVDGRGTLSICKVLNREGIPSPQNARKGSNKSEWGPDPIKDILSNEKYKGWNVWNVTHQEEHPKTFKLMKHRKSAHEHIRFYNEDLRMVSDELWERAAGRRQEMQDEQARRVQGGYNRAINAPYLFSGLLLCGECDRKLIINGKRGKGRYKCPGHVYARGCSNGMSIIEAELTRQLCEYLSGSLFDQEYIDTITSETFTVLERAWKKEQQAAGAEELVDIERQFRECERQIDTLLDKVEEGGPGALMKRLAQREFEMDRLQEKRDILRGKKKFRLTREKLAEQVRENIGRLEDVLKADGHLARQMLAQHLKPMLVFADHANYPNEIVITGEMNLFAPELQDQVSTLVGDWGIRIPEQSTDVLSPASPKCDPFYRFAISMSVAVEETCLFMEPITRILMGKPELADKLMKPGEWAELARLELGSDEAKDKRMGSGAMGRCFRVHRAYWEERFYVTKTPNPANPAGHVYGLRLREKVEASEELSMAA